MGFGYAIYFSERVASRVSRWEPDTGKVDILAGDPKEKNPDQKLHEPYGLAFDSGGSLLIADKLQNRVCRLQKGRLETLALRDVTGHRALRPGSCRGFEPAVLKAPTSLFAERGGAVLCTFFSDQTIYRIHADLRLDLVLGVVMNRCYSHDGVDDAVPPSRIPDRPLLSPTGVVARSDGTLFFIERGYQVVREYHPSRGLRTLLRSCKSEGKHPSGAPPQEQGIRDYLPHVPTALALGPEEQLYLCDGGEGSIVIIDLGAGVVRRVLRTPPPSNPALQGGPSALAFGPDGTAWVADSSTGTIQAYEIQKTKAWKPQKAKLGKIGTLPLNITSGGMGLVTRK